MRINYHSLLGSFRIAVHPLIASSNAHFQYTPSAANTKGAAGSLRYQNNYCRFCILYVSRTMPDNRVKKLSIIFANRLIRNIHRIHFILNMSLARIVCQLEAMKGDNMRSSTIDNKLRHAISLLKQNYHMAELCGWHLDVLIAENKKHGQ